MTENRLMISPVIFSRFFDVTYFYVYIFLIKILKNAVKIADVDDVKITGNRPV